MADPSSGDKQEDKPPKPNTINNRAALCALLISLTSLVGLIFFLLHFPLPPITSSQGSLSPAFLTTSVLYIVLFITAIMSGYIAYKLAAPNASPSKGPTPEDLKANSTAFTQLVHDCKDSGTSVDADKIAEIFMKLRSLYSWTGTFNYLGVTGLPLATIALTLVFTIMALLMALASIKWNDAHATPFLDLAKLTLGAFIGSFVQKHVEQAATAQQQAIAFQRSIDPKATDPKATDPKATDPKATDQ